LFKHSARQPDFAFDVETLAAIIERGVDLTGGVERLQCDSGVNIFEQKWFFALRALERYPPVHEAHVVQAQVFKRRLLGLARIGGEVPVGVAFWARDQAHIGAFKNETLHLDLAGQQRHHRDREHDALRGDERRVGWKSLWVGERRLFSRKAKRRPECEFDAAEREVPSGRLFDAPFRLCGREVLGKKDDEQPHRHNQNGDQRAKRNSNGSEVHRPESPVLGLISRWRI